MPDRNPRISTFDFSLLLLRLTVGTVFILHGSQKLFGILGGDGMEAWIGMVEGMEVPYPQFAAWAAAIAEFGGGILLVLGLITRIAAIPLICVMAVAIAKVHWPNGFFLPGGMEYALTLGVVNLAFLLSGGGDLSLDAVLFGGCCRRKTAEEDEFEPAEERRPDAI